MEIAIASDHAGYALKEEIKHYLNEKRFNVIDYGCKSHKSVDYPDFAEKIGKGVVDGNILGIAICGTGIGMCIACNKIHGVRAALVYDEFTAKMAKQHNNANIICLGGRTCDFEKAQKFIDIFLETSFEDGRHQKRIEKIHALEK